MILRAVRCIITIVTNNVTTITYADKDTCDANPYSLVLLRHDGLYMSRNDLTVRAVRSVLLGIALCTTYEALRRILPSLLSPWQAIAASVVFVAIVTFLVGRRAVRWEQECLTAIRAHEDFSNAVINSLPVPLCIVDATGHFLRWNKEAETKLGYSREQLSEITLLAIVWERDHERVKQAVDATLNGTYAEVEAVLVGSSGKRTPFYLTGARIVFEGKPCILGIAVDISVQTRAQEQLRLQAAALRAAANGIVITAKDGTIEWVNPAFAEMTGFGMEEVVGKNPRMLKSGRQGEEFYERMWATISSGRVWRGEITNCRKDKTQYIEEMTITPVWSGDGRIEHYIAIKQDISARKAAESAQQRAEERYRDIFDQAVVGIFQSTPDGHFLMMNRAMARMLHCECPEQAVDEDKGTGHFYGSGTKRQELQTRLEAEGTLHCEHEILLKDGTELWLSLNMRCIYNEDGTPAYYEGTAEDITERKHLERQLRQAQKMEAVGRLAGGVAHDFNNMLGVIAGYSELLKLRTDLDGTVGHQIEQIHTAARKAALLTQQLLAFSRKQIVQRRILDLNEGVAALSNMLRRSHWG